MQRLQGYCRTFWIMVIFVLGSWNLEDPIVYTYKSYSNWSSTTLVHVVFPVFKSSTSRPVGPGSSTWGAGSTFLASRATCQRLEILSRLVVDLVCQVDRLVPQFSPNSPKVHYTTFFSWFGRKCNGWSWFGRYLGYLLSSIYLAAAAA